MICLTEFSFTAEKLGDVEARLQGKATSSGEKLNITDVQIKRLIMPSFNCKCGNRLKYGDIPNPIELLVISDVEYDSFTGKIDSEELYDKMKSILICNNCNRLWYFKNGFQNEPIVYSLEDYLCRCSDT